MIDILIYGNTTGLWRMKFELVLEKNRYGTLKHIKFKIR